MLLPVVLILSLSTLAFAVDSPFQCQSGAYTWCAHLPDGYDPSSLIQWPTIPFMPGSGARGCLSDAPDLATYDGVGKLITQYTSGNWSLASQLAACSFITIVAISPSDNLHFMPDLIRSVLSDAGQQYSIDPDRTSVVGYSMGSRGTWRELTFNTDLYAAGVTAAGAAETSNGSYIRRQPVPPTFPLLQNVLGVPIRSFVGSVDVTAPAEESVATQEEIERLGGDQSSLHIIAGADHTEMSTMPFQDPELYIWLLTQHRSSSPQRRPRRRHISLTDFTE